MGATRALQRRRIIERPRLIALLDESTARVRTLIAPAGYGKTTLAEQWVEKEGRRGAWFTARPSSTDVAALALGMARAATEIVTECDARLREHLRALPAPAEHVDVLAELLGEDLEGWPTDAWLVLDDYQEVAGSEDAEKFVEELVSVSPIQLLIASRQRPSWITARRILYGEILELNQTELAMDGHEAAEVLTERNAASASGLVALANGWPAVIGLASVSGAEIEDGESVPESLYQFFAEEVFNALEPDVQEGLATLALAPVMDRSLAGILLGERAEPVCSAALNVGILVERGARLETHPLARAFLDGWYEHTDVTSGTAGAERCLTYYSERGDWDAAFDLIVRHELFSALEPVMESALDELLASARLSTIEKWCECADRNGLEDAVFSMARAEVALRRGRLAAARAHAERVVPRSSDLEFRALSIAGRAAHLESREEEALELFRRAEASAPTDALRRIVLWDQVLCMIDLEAPEAIDTIERLGSGLDQDDPRELVRAASCKCLCQARLGRIDLTEAERASQLLPMVKDPMVETGFLSMFAFTLAAAARYVEARQVARVLLSTAERYRFDFALPWATSVYAAAQTGLREWSEAEAGFRTGIELSRDASNRQAEQHCIAGLVRMLCQRARYEEALAISAALPQSQHLTLPLRATRAELLASRALVLASADRADDAHRTIDLVRGHSRGGEHIVLTAAVDAIVALKRHEAQAIDRVKELHASAFATGALDLLVVAYRSVPALLPVLVHIAAPSDGLTELIRRAGDSDLARTLGLSMSPVDGPRATLTGREREVYELLRQGLTNREIAELLFITEATVKLHVHHIFDKLGVRSRKAIAVQAALERSAQATSAMGETDPGSNSSLLL